MKQYKFSVSFSNGLYPVWTVDVMAFSAQEAIILAQAVRIKAGLDYTICEVKRITSPH